MRLGSLALATIVLVVAGCSETSDQAGEPTLTSGTAIQIPAPGALTTTTTGEPGPTTVTPDTTATDRTPATPAEIDLDLVVTVDGAEYAMPTSMCSPDPGVARSTLNQLMVAARQAIDQRASGWPTTTMGPDPSAGEQLERLAIATTAVAIRLDLLGIWQSRIRDINQSYIDEDAGVTQGPIDQARLDRWLTEAEPLVVEIQRACSG